MIELFDGTIRDRIHRGEIHIVAISPLTASVVAEHELPVAAVAKEATIDGLIEELIRMALEREDGAST